MNSINDGNSISSRISPLTTSLLYPLGRRIILPAFFREIRVEGFEHFPQTGPLIIAPTHRSRWDGLVIGYTFGRPTTGRNIRYMVSINEMVGLQGWLIRQFGGFPIDPDRPAISTLRHGVELLLQAEPLVIFGEGNVFRQPEVQHLKPGLARMALQAQRLCRNSPTPSQSVQVLPVGLCYSDPCPHYGSSLVVRIGKPLDVQDYLLLSPKQGANRLTTDLIGALNHLMQVQVPMAIASLPAQAPAN
jgi:1-acyl-sn-glycerol-3-phosphate acyltransferase